MPALDRALPARLDSLPWKPPPNALLYAVPGWGPTADFLVVLFLHGLEANAVEKWEPLANMEKHHRLPAQLKASGKNVVLIGPRLSTQGGVDPAPFSTLKKLDAVVTDGLTTLLAARAGGELDAASVTAARGRAWLLPVGFSGGYTPWTAAMASLSKPGLFENRVVGGALFDCLYWDSFVLDGGVPPGQRKRAARTALSAPALAALRAGFFAAFRTTGNETGPNTEVFRKLVTTQIAADKKPGAAAATPLTLAAKLADALGAGSVVLEEGVAPAHIQAVGKADNLARLLRCVPGFDLATHPPTPVA